MIDGEAPEAGKSKPSVTIPQPATASSPPLPPLPPVDDVVMVDVNAPEARKKTSPLAERAKRVQRHKERNHLQVAHDLGPKKRPLPQSTKRGGRQAAQVTHKHAAAQLKKPGGTMERKR